MRQFKIHNNSLPRQIGILIPANLHKAVAKKCKAEDVTLTRIIKDFLKMWVNGEKQN